MYCFIVNPVAGHGKCLKLMNMLTEVLLSRNIEYEVVYSDAAGHAKTLAFQAVGRGCDTVVVVGGDGTLKEAAAGIVEAGGKAVLGIIPGGTGNDYRRSMNIPIECIDALEIVLKGHSRSVDAALFNGELFLNIGSAGFDASVVETTKKMKWMGAMSYYAAVFMTLMQYRSQKVRLWIDDVLQEKEFLLMAVGNGTYYGGGMKAMPEAVPDDGKMDVFTVDNIPRYKIAMLFPQFPTGGHVKFPFVKFYRCEQMRIETLGEPFSVQTDGEVYSGIRTAQFSILPGALRVLVPSGYSGNR